MISGHVHNLYRIIELGADCHSPESRGNGNQLPCPQAVVKKAITDGEIGYAFDMVTVENDIIFFKRFGTAKIKKLFCGSSCSDIINNIKRRNLKG